MIYIWKEQLNKLREWAIEQTEASSNSKAAKQGLKDKCQCDKRMPKIMEDIRRQSFKGQNTSSRFKDLNDIEIEELKAAGFDIYRDSKGYGSFWVIRWDKR